MEIIGPRVGARGIQICIRMYVVVKHESDFEYSGMYIVKLV